MAFSSAAGFSALAPVTPLSPLGGVLLAAAVADLVVVAVVSRLVLVVLAVAVEPKPTENDRKNNSIIL